MAGSAGSEGDEQVGVQGRNHGTREGGGSEKEVIRLNFTPCSSVTAHTGGMAGEPGSMCTSCFIISRYCTTSGSDESWKALLPRW